jgi:hypothetical protein
MTIRERDAAAALTQFLNELLVADIRFAWGQWDCNTFVLAWLDRMTGGNLLAHYRGGYDTEESARTFAAQLPLSLRGVCQAAGLHAVAGGPRFAQAGDVLLVRDGDNPWWRGHVCAGATFVSVWPGSGLEAHPMRGMPDDAVTLRYC